MPTLKQQRAVAKMVGNGGNVTKAMREVGYSENTLNTPQRLTDSKGYKEAIKPVLEQLIKKRQLAIDSLTDVKLEKANAEGSTRVIDLLTKNIQLLGNKPTEIINEYTNLTDEELIKRREKYRAGTSEQGTIET